MEVCDVVARGGVVGGSSAGLAIMSEIMIGAGEPVDDKPARAELSFGFGVLKNVIAEQHFDARRGRIERLTGVLRDHKRLVNLEPTCKPRTLIGMAVEEDTALILSGRRMRVSGKKMAHIFVQSVRPRTIIWHALHPGDHAAMTLQGDELVLSPEDWGFE
jgi:cyanophycinase-like exopeptidase